MKVKEGFDQVCDVGTSIFCAPAMIQLGKRSRETLEAIEDISMAQTISAEAVKNFEDRKLQIITYLNQVAWQPEERTIDLSEGGETTT